MTHMRYLLLMGFLFTLGACAQKKKWDKATIVNKCLGEFTKQNEKEKRLTTMQLADICDCLGDKMSVKYKTEKEADADKDGVQEMSMNCAMEAMQK